LLFFNSVGAAGFEPPENAAFPHDPERTVTEEAPEPDASEGLSVGSVVGVTERSLLPSGLETALAAALERASAAGQWDVVMALAAELRARRGG